MSEETLRQQAPSIFASGPMLGVSQRYTFVPTAQIVDGLREHDWVPVAVEEQRIRNEARRGFQKHLIRFRRAEQMETLDEWNVELVLLNSHDRGCAYQLHAGIYRRICSNGLVTVRDRNSRPSGSATPACWAAKSCRRAFACSTSCRESANWSTGSAPACWSRASRWPWPSTPCVLRYDSVAEAPVEPDTLLKARRPEDEGTDLWRSMNRSARIVERGGVSDWHRDRRGKLRSVRALAGHRLQGQPEQGALGRGRTTGQRRTAAVTGQRGADGVSCLQQSRCSAARKVVRLRATVITTVIRLSGIVPNEQSSTFSTV